MSDNEVTVLPDPETPKELADHLRSHGLHTLTLHGALVGHAMSAHRHLHRLGDDHTHPSSPDVRVRDVVDRADELARLRLAMRKLNRLRSNVIATQNASWSNQMYPLVAILNEAGYEVQGATEAQMQEHLACYGGAGRTPKLLDESPYEGPSPALSEAPSGSVMIHAERWRQQHEEGFTAEHDVAEHPNGELKDAAVCYAIAANGPGAKPADVWPWTHEWWKPTVDPIPNLVKAGALIAAEIDRIVAARAGDADV